MTAMPGNLHQPVPPRRGRVRAAFAALLLAFVIAPAGCQRAPATGAPPRTDLALASPLEATQTVLAALQAQLHAAWRGDHRAADAEREWLIDYVVAQEQVLTRGRARTTAEQRELLRNLVDSWASIIAYYADGMALEHPTLIPAAADKFTILIPARGPQDRATILVTALQGADRQWRIGAIDLGPAQTAPASQIAIPASQSQPAVPPSATAPAP